MPWGFLIKKREDNELLRPDVDVDISTGDHGGINVRFETVTADQLKRLNCERLKSEQAEMNREKRRLKKRPSLIIDMHSPFMPPIEEVLKNKILNIIQKSIDAGLDITSTVRLVQPLVPPEYEAESIVRTESVFLYNKKMYNWAINNDEYATEWQYVGPYKKYNRKLKEYETLQDECFDNGMCGGRVLGELYPTGHLIPPAHSGCCCGLRYMSKNDSGLKLLSKDQQDILRKSGL